MEIATARFKAECLKLVDRVEKTRKPIVITKHGRAVAQLAPVSAAPASLFGYMKGTLRIVGNVSAPIEAKWNALSGNEDHLSASSKRRRR